MRSRCGRDAEGATAGPAESAVWLAGGVVVCYVQTVGEGDEQWERPLLGDPRFRGQSLESVSVQVAITCRHGNIPQETHEYISRKSEKLLNLFERVTAIEVTIDFEKDRVKTEIKVDAEHKHDFVASVIGEEPGPTFDKTLSKMEQQIRKYKEKLTDHRRDPSLSELAEPAVESSEDE